jgi:hypothetical protein
MRARLEQQFAYITGIEESASGDKILSASIGTPET